jgi:hypothetical protein
MHNARLAITALGIEASYDTFHNKVLFGYKDDKARHVVESILGDVTDRASPPQAAIAWSVAASSRSASACGFGTALCDMDAPVGSGRAEMTFSFCSVVNRG